MTAFGDRLRALPAFPDGLATLDVEAVQDDPLQLLRAWLEDAIAAGERQPHAMTFTTVDDAGAPSSRTLIVKDIDGAGVHVSSSATSRKAAHLAAERPAGMLFFLRSLGRQIELTGPVHDLGPAAAAADWAARPNYDGAENPDWRVWALDPDRVEFLQAREDRRHTRVEYLRDATGGWRHRPLQASEAH